MDGASWDEDVAGRGGEEGLVLGAGRVARVVMTVLRAGDADWARVREHVGKLDGDGGEGEVGVRVAGA